MKIQTKIQHRGVPRKNDAIFSVSGKFSADDGCGRLAPSCKTGLKIKKASLIGTRISCPKCKKKIDVVTPEEDGYISYGIEEAPEARAEPEPSEVEMEEIEFEEDKKRPDSVSAAGVAHRIVSDSS